jgi:small subunit ribosomal protein S17
MAEKQDNENETEETPVEEPTPEAEAATPAVDEGEPVASTEAMDEATPEAEEPVVDEPVAEEEPVAEAAPEPEAAPEAEAEAEAEPEPEAATEPEPAAEEPPAEAEAEPAPADEPAAEKAEPAAEAPPAPVQQSGPKPKRKRLPRALRPRKGRVKRERSTTRKEITRLPKPEREFGRRQERQGTVVSDKGDKTIVVKVDTIKAHPRYKKVVRRSKRFHAHDEQNAAKIGDVVRIVETRPLSKTKNWRLAEIVEVAK